jgi:hypothetical protein
VIPLRNHIRLGAAALITASAALAANTSFAVPRYDGVWSVSIFTTRGDCIASYRYPMRIANGVLANGGDLAINVSGRVAPGHAEPRRYARRSLRPPFRQRRPRLVERGVLFGLVDRAAAQFIDQIPAPCREGSGRGAVRRRF